MNNQNLRGSLKNAVLTNILRETSQTATFYYAKVNRLKIGTCLPLKMLLTIILISIEIELIITFGNENSRSLSFFR